MLGSAILEIAIALLFLFVLLGIVCSALQEFVSSLLQLRASSLQKGIVRMLDPHPDEGVPSRSLSEFFFRHPLIRSRNMPNLLQGKLFVRHIAKYFGDRRPAHIEAGDFSRVVLSKLVPDDGSAPTKDGVLAEIDKLPAGGPKEALRTLFIDARANFERFRAGVEGWFDAEMESVSDLYKRHSQFLIAFFALLVAGVLNVDTLQIARTLWTDAGLRARIVAEAEAAVQEPPPALAPADPDVATASEANAPTGPAQAAERLRAEVETLEALQLPIGWAGESDLAGQDWRFWAEKIVGILLSALAASLGAPFWFDLLNKLVNLRYGGKQQATAAKPKGGGA